ncbi:unnamed protein product [Cylindrotheca closterium]|uniref:Uncharacterized protein n=1 Tax=Cylindrotheca closterium TaxID=2856 RepID=A0AAD2FQ78_9STRA|nr:unnamed protein product [Cylindrotheca closterium]
MTKILLSCNAEEHENAQKIQAAIREQLGFAVMMDVEDWQNHSSKEEEMSLTLLDSNLEAASLLLVFQFGYENISAWVMIEESDERKRDVSMRNEYEDEDDEDYFPECVDFSESIAEGIVVFEDILKHNLGLVLRGQPEKKTATYCSSADEEILTAEVTLVAPLAEVQSVAAGLSKVDKQDSAATSSSNMPTTIPSDLPKFLLNGRGADCLINKFKRRLSLQ